MLGFPGGSDSKVSTCNEGDLGLILGWEDILEKGKATHSSILAWRIPWTIARGVVKSWTQPSDFHFHFHYNVLLSSVQFSSSVVSDSLQPHES